MNKLYTLLAVALFSCNIQAAAQKCGTQSDNACPVAGLAESFAQGAAAGSAATITVELLRNYILPDLTKYNLFGNYNVCRDQLTGIAKVFTAALGTKVLACADKCDSADASSELAPCDVANMAARFMGLVAGYCVTSYAQKLVGLTPKAAA